MYVQSCAGMWECRSTKEQRWFPASVPGSVHVDLLAAGLITDPFVGDEEKRVQWVAESDWEYRRTFAVDPRLLAEEKVFLACDGLDTLAQVAINGQAVGQAENMFRQYRWEVKSLLREGENELTVSLASPVRYARGKMDERPLLGVRQALPGAPYVRKAPCHFGWDWGPMLPPIGIWQDIRLEGRSVARLDDVHVQQRHQDGQVIISTGLAVERWQKGDLVAVLRLTEPGGKMSETRAAAASGTLEIAVDNPQLWWTNGLGEQPLYQVQILLLAGETALDQRDYQLGLRRIELRREKDEWGESFTFAINGVPIFAKGSNWIPADSFLTRFTDDSLEHLVCSAADSNQNMLRVWGGGIYEQERFYDLCDRYGILVWQDFSFACSIYPLDDPAFVQNVRIEVEENVKRLRHRASLALWCGNNEMEWGWGDWGWDRPEHKDLKAAYDRFFHHLLPTWCATLDPDHAYWPSSPSSGIAFDAPNAEERGDAHFWGVWHGRMPFTAYRGRFPRFMSEFGFQALPPLATIATYAEQKDWNMTSYIMEHHQRGNHGNGLILAQMTDTFCMPKDFSSLVYLSLILQAEGIRYGVEHWRRNMDRVSGTLYWQLNDCWPVASWASIDYFGRWKALHYAAKRFYAPLMLSIEESGTAMAVSVTSDLTESWDGVVRWSLETLDGRPLQTGEKVVSAAPLANTPVCALDFEDVIPDGHDRNTVFACELWQGQDRLALQIATFVPSKHLELIDPGLAATVRQEDGQLGISVTAHSLARFVELAFDGTDVVFGDNYFDLPAGRTATVTCPLPKGWTLEQAKAALRVRSLYDSCM